MTIYRVTPTNGAPVLRSGRGLAGAVARAGREFPAGVASVEPVPIEELADMAAGGAMLPMSGRQAVAVFNAVKREKARGLRAKDRREAAAAAAKLEAKEKALEARQAAQRAAREARARERASAARKVRAAAIRAASNGGRVSEAASTPSSPAVEPAVRDEEASEEFDFAGELVDPTSAPWD